MPNAYDFPDQFVWGVATAATQIEGAAAEDGKGESIWDRFAATPGGVKTGDTPAVACDHYHRYEDDAALMRGLGIGHYRLSVAWPRVIPQGDGPLNPRGLDFYDRLIDALLRHNITPWVTLFHWDLPQALEDRGGWLERPTVDAFGAYADAVVKRLGDRVTRWFTLNEMPCFIGNGYSNGTFAPGRRVGAKLVNRGYHHALLAHGHGVAAVRAHGGPNATVGLVHNHLPAPQIPLTETEVDIAAARLLYLRTNGPLMGPLFRGAYPDDFLDEAGGDAPEILPGDLDWIAQPTDYLGLNIYAGDFVHCGRDGSPEVVPFPPGYPRGNMPWLYHTPQSLYWGVRHAAEGFGVKTFLITENGTACNDRRDANGQVLDLDRREYLRSYLAELHRAIVEGLDVRGYFVWSLLDNFEWAEGYAKRFGIVHIDYATQLRTPKLSAGWYSDVIRDNRLV
jgi:beta-glucosidase